MKIAFTHNLKQTDSEKEAEFDTPETIASISEGLRKLGHQVELVEVSGPPSRTLAKLEALNPDLVFNTAEGHSGKFREAFFPAVFDQLGLPFTGSDAYVCTLTLDKNLTKTVLSKHGIPTPKSLFVHQLSELKKNDLRFPVILKPNFEGSSKGISQKSVVENESQLENRLKELLTQYPHGILIEEFIEGKDVTVPFIEGISPETHGVLTPAEYQFDTKGLKEYRYSIYDYDLKNKYSDAVSVKVPADVSPETQKQLIQYSKKIVQIIGIRDFSRIDFRLAPDGSLYFIEINALPSLEPGAGIYLSAMKAGLGEVEKVLDAILQSAIRRNQIKTRKRPPSKKLRVGFTYNEKRVTPGEDPSTDAEAEYDSPKTLDAIREAISSFGHEVVNLETSPDLTNQILSANVDLVFNISEGIRGRNREAQVPAILELLDIPYTGSDPATLSLSLDKGLAKRIVREAGVPTPQFFVLTTGKERLPKDFRFPAIIKPLAEGSSKGVLKKSVAQNEMELREIANEMITRYRQAALAEEFLPGREFTVALLGEKRPYVLPPMEIVFQKSEDPFPIYSYQHKLATTSEVRYEAPAKIDDSLKKKLEQTAKKAFMALGCRDVARIDVRLDRNGTVHFIECNPLPGLSPGWSDLCLIAESAGMSYRDLIGEILSPAIRRLKQQRKELLIKTEAPKT